MLFIDKIRAFKSRFAENCDSLVKARLSERKRVEEQLNTQHNDEIARIERKHKFAINDLNSEIKSRDEHIKSLQDIVRNVGEVHEDAVRVFQIGNRFVHDVRRQSESLLTVMAQYHQHIAAMEDDAAVQQKRIEEAAPKLQAKLRQRELKV